MEIGLLQIVVTKEGFLKARRNDFDALPKETLVAFKNSLNDYIDEINAVLFKKGLVSSKPSNIVGILKNEIGIVVHFDNRLLSDMGEDEIEHVVLALEESIRAVKEKASMD